MVDQDSVGGQSLDSGPHERHNQELIGQQEEEKKQEDDSLVEAHRIAVEQQEVNNVEGQVGVIAADQEVIQPRIEHNRPQEIIEVEEVCDMNELEG